jgi:hypothetical protein
VGILKPSKRTCKKISSETQKRIIKESPFRPQLWSEDSRMIPKIQYDLLSRDMERMCYGTFSHEFVISDLSIF